MVSAFLIGCASFFPLTDSAHSLFHREGYFHKNWDASDFSFGQPISENVTKIFCDSEERG